MEDKKFWSYLTQIQWIAISQEGEVQKPSNIYMLFSMFCFIFLIIFICGNSFWAKMRWCGFLTSVYTQRGRKFLFLKPSLSSMTSRKDGKIQFVNQGVTSQCSTDLTEGSPLDISWQNAISQVQCSPFYINSFYITFPVYINSQNQRFSPKTFIFLALLISTSLL